MAEPGEKFELPEAATSAIVLQLSYGDWSMHPTVFRAFIDKLTDGTLDLSDPLYYMTLMDALNTIGQMFDFCDSVVIQSATVAFVLTAYYYIVEKCGHIDPESLTAPKTALKSALRQFSRVPKYEANVDEQLKERVREVLSAEG